MKKTILTITLLSILGIVPNMQAQETATEHLTTESTAIQQQEETIDSLRQALKVLEEKVNVTENDNLDQKIWKNRSKFMHIGYVADQTLTGDMVKLNSEWGVMITSGRTYYLHKKPILGMIKIGLDLAWSDINFAMYKDEFNLVSEEETEDEEEEGILGDLGSLQLEYAMRVGPSITINPVGELKVSGYFHFTPSLSMLKLDEEFYYNYASFFNAGGAISYKAISAGVEWRWGKAKYEGFNTNFMDMDFDEEDFEYEEGIPNINDIIENSKITDKFKTKSFRVYLSLRF